MSDGRKLAFAAPRQFAKSTLCSFLLPMWALCLEQRHFILLLSNTHDQAVKFLHAIKFEWETNSALRQAFLHITPDPDKWAEDEIEFRVGNTKTKLLARGTGAQLRGLKFLHYRPDLIVLDDIENDELVDSESRRNDLQWWFDHVVLYTNPDAWLVVVGTILHEQALLNRLVRKAEPRDQRAYPDWQTRLYKAYDFDHSTWEQKESTGSLHALMQKDEGTFQQEKQNEPFSPTYQPFQSEFFSDRRWFTDPPRELTLSLTVDPACSEKEASDETAICVAGWDVQGRLWVLDLWHGRESDPSLILEQLFSLYTKWKRNEETNPYQRLACVGIEKVAFQKFLIHLFEQEARRRGYRPYVKELKGDMRKVRRIWQLEPLFRDDRIFLRPSMTDLEQQLRSFRLDGKYAHDDLADALAYHLQLGASLPQPAPDEPREEALTLAHYMKISEEVAERRKYQPDLMPVVSAKGIDRWYWVRN